MIKRNHNLFAVFLFVLIIWFSYLTFQISSIKGQAQSSSSSSSGMPAICVACAEPLCSSGQILSTPKNPCLECSKCIDVSSSSSSSSSSGECIDCHWIPCPKVGPTDCAICTPCTSSSSSSGNLIQRIAVNKNFTGIWKGKTLKTISPILPASSQGECFDDICGLAFCRQNPQDPRCAPEVIMCQAEPVSVPCNDPKCNFGPCIRSNEIFGTITLQLCVKEGKLEGTIHENGFIDNGVITSQDVISPSKVIVTVKDENGKIETVTLKLHSFVGRILSGTFSNGKTFRIRKVGKHSSCPPFICKKPCGQFCCYEGETCRRATCSVDSKRCFPAYLGCELSTSSSSSGCAIPCGLQGSMTGLCCSPTQICKVDDPCMGDPACTSLPSFECIPSTSSSSSGGIVDCSSRGSCSGSNDLEILTLPCPEGTFCSGLPAYGCYPPGCPVPICCSADTRIRTTGIQKRIADIKEGDLVLTDGEKAVHVIKTSKTEVKKHTILKVRFNDGIVLEVSPSHPTADGRLFKDLKIGDVVDKRVVVETKSAPYNYKYTYDILPDSPTGNYYANGILIGSTLKR